MLKKSYSALSNFLGGLFLLLAFIGIFLPLLPTTPFVLLAAYYFSKGSPRLHAWLLRNKIFGPVILDWQKRGAINLKSKLLASSMLLGLFTYTFIFVPVNLAIKISVAMIGFSVLTFLWTRPSS